MKNLGKISGADQFRIAASIGRDLPEFCTSFGIDIKLITQPLQINFDVFKSFEERISLDRFCRLFEVLATVASDEALGIRYGQFYTVGSSGPFGLGLRAAPTFKDMLNFYVRYESVIVDASHFSSIIESDKFTIDWSYSPLISQRAQFVDFTAVQAMRLCERSAGRRVTPLEVHLERGAPRDMSFHRRTFPGKLFFEAPSNRIVFSSELLACVNPNADPVTFEYMGQQCENLSSGRRRKKDIVTIVKEDLIQNMKEADFGIERVADRCGVSERTLQRRLRESDINFAELLDQTRDELSMGMLQEQDLPLSEISYRLGYSSQSAYTRAVKRIHGVSPGVLRTQAK